VGNSHCSNFWEVKDGAVYLLLFGGRNCMAFGGKGENPLAENLLVFWMVGNRTGGGSFLLSPGIPNFCPILLPEQEKQY
jgi:hypothetical protein